MTPHYDAIARLTALSERLDRLRRQAQEVQSLATEEVRAALYRGGAGPTRDARQNRISSPAQTARGALGL
jgi:hypothetical protein